MRLNFSSILTLVFLTLSATGKAQQPAVSPAAPDAGTANLKWIYSAVLKPKCSVCHGEVANYDSLSKSGWVVSGNPENSDLFTSIVANAGQKPYMPEEGAPVGNRGVRAIYWWIKSGAKPQSAN